MTETIRATASRLVIQSESFIRAFNLQPMIDRALSGAARDSLSDEEIMQRRDAILYGFMLSSVCSWALALRDDCPDFIAADLGKLARELPHSMSYLGERRSSTQAAAQIIPMRSSEGTAGQLDG